jgi:hypothetical protein
LSYYYYIKDRKILAISDYGSIEHSLSFFLIQSLMLWNFVERQKMTMPAHDNLVSALAVSDVTGLVASVSHDKHFKIWK